MKALLSALIFIMANTALAGGSPGPTRDLISQESAVLGENLAFLCANIKGGQTVAITIRPDKGILEVRSHKSEIKLELSVNTYRWSDSSTLEKEFQIQHALSPYGGLLLQVALEPNFLNNKITSSAIRPQAQGYEAVIGTQQYQCTKVFGHPDGVFN